MEETKVNEIFISLKKYFDKETGCNSSNVDQITEHIYVSNTYNIINKSELVDILLFITTNKKNKDLVDLHKIKKKDIYNIPVDNKNNLKIPCNKTFEIIYKATLDKSKILIVSEYGIELPFITVINYFITKYYLIYNTRSIKKNIKILNFDNFYIQKICEFIKEKRTCLHLTDESIYSLIWLEVSFKNGITKILSKHIAQYENERKLNIENKTEHIGKSESKSKIEHIGKNEIEHIGKNESEINIENKSESKNEIEHIGKNESESESDSESVEYIDITNLDSVDNKVTFNIITDDDLEKLMEEKLMEEK